MFVRLECPQKFHNFIPQPSYHPKNKNVVIISTHYVTHNKGIYEYNLTQNTFSKMYTYDQTFRPSFHGQFIDSKNELLYIFGGGTFGIFDLNTKVMNSKTENTFF
eukprot:496270_1